MWGREPVAWAALVRAAIGLASAFGFNLSGEQVASIMLFVEVVLALVTRQSVTPNTTVRAAMASPAAGRELERKLDVAHG